MAPHKIQVVTNIIFRHFETRAESLKNQYFMIFVPHGRASPRSLDNDIGAE